MPSIAYRHTVKKLLCFVLFFGALTLLAGTYSVEEIERRFPSPTKLAVDSEDLKRDLAEMNTYFELVKDPYSSWHYKKFLRSVIEIHGSNYRGIPKEEYIELVMGFLREQLRERFKTQLAISIRPPQTDSKASMGGAIMDGVQDAAGKTSIGLGAVGVYAAKNALMRPSPTMLQRLFPSVFSKSATQIISGTVGRAVAGPLGAASLVYTSYCVYSEYNKAVEQDQEDWIEYASGNIEAELERLRQQCENEIRLYYK